MSIQLSYLSAIFLLVYFGIGIYIFYFFRKRFHGRFEGQGYKFPAIIYFISVPLIIAIGTNFFNDYNPSQVLTFEIDVMFKIAFLYIWITAGSKFSHVNSALLDFAESLGIWRLWISILQSCNFL